MFTGIIQELGTVTRVERTQGLVRLSVAAPKIASKVQRLDSVAVNGVCLSVVSVRQQLIGFEVIRETQALTTLSGLRRGHRVNLEPSLGVCDRLSGHLVFGHVDGIGRIAARRQLAGELVLEVQVETGLRRWVVPKGPVAIDGISLTVGRALRALSFTVHVIPETLRLTTLGQLGVGARVNVEIDYFAKLLWQFVREGTRRHPVPRPGRLVGSPEPL